MNLRKEAKDIYDCLLTARIRVALVDEKERNNARNSIKYFSRDSGSCYCAVDSKVSAAPSSDQHRRDRAHRQKFCILKIIWQDEVSTFDMISDVISILIISLFYSSHRKVSRKESSLAAHDPDIFD